MAWKIRWSKEAIQDRKAILGYWEDRTRSKIYSQKLNSQFLEGLEIIRAFPLIGKITSIENVRSKVVRD